VLLYENRVVILVRGKQIILILFNEGVWFFQKEIILRSWVKRLKIEIEELCVVEITCDTAAKTRTQLAEGTKYSCVGSIYCFWG